MSKEGYLQIKISDLNKKLEEIEKEIQNKVDLFEKIEKRISDNIKITYDHLSPLLELEDKLKGLRKVILNHSEVQTQNQLDSFNSTIQKNIDKYLKDNFIDINNSVGIKVNREIDRFIKELNELRELDGKRFDNLINILNKRGITNITSVIYDVNKRRILKRRNLNQESKSNVD